MRPALLAGRRLLPPGTLFGRARRDVSGFPGTSLLVFIRFAFGADVAADPNSWVWTDVTTDWHVDDGVTVKDGRSEGATQAEPAEITFTLRNQSGDYTPDDARSQHWPYVAEGTPVWFVVNAGLGDLTLFEGFVTSLTPTWPGRSDKLPLVKVQANGILAILGRGESPLKSPLYRAILRTNPVAYWPCEDGQNATQAVSVIPGVAPLSVINEMSFSSVSGPAGSETSLPSFAKGRLTGQVPVDSAATSWRAEFVVKIEKPVAEQVTLFTWLTRGRYNIGKVVVDFVGGLPFTGVILDIPYLGFEDSIGAGFAIDDGKWHHIRLEVKQQGPLTLYLLDIDGVNRVNWLAGYSIAFDQIQQIYLGEQYDGLSLGHLAVWTPWPAHSSVDTYRAFAGYDGEMASARILRLCTEENTRISVEPGESAVMGPQAADTFLNLLRECEATDEGRLSEARFGLHYRPRVSLYRQTPKLTIDGSNRELSEPFSPARDLQRVRNEWTLTRRNGSKATVADVEHQRTRSRLNDSGTINPQTDAALLHNAEWRVGIGTTPGMRYPSLSINPARSPQLIGPWQSIQLGDRVQAINLLTQHPLGAVDQIVEGRQQTIQGRRVWRVTMTTSPASPYDVFVIEGDGNSGRLDSASATLDADVDETQTTMAIATGGGPLLTTDPADMPVDVDVDGEQIRIETITGSSSPQTATVTRAVNGITKTHRAGANVRLWQGSGIAL